MFVFEFWLTHEKVSVIISFGSVCKLVIFFNKEKNMISRFYFPHSPGKHRLWSVSLLFRKVKKTLCFIWFLLSELSSFSLWMILWCDVKTIQVVKVASFVLFEFLLINPHALFGCWDTETWNLIEIKFTVTRGGLCYDCHYFMESLFILFVFQNFWDV